MRFITPVNIKISLINSDDIISELKKIGYKLEDHRDKKSYDKYLLTNWNSDDRQIGFDTQILSINGRECSCQEEFLALAAMTDNPDGNIGEYWKCLVKTGGGFTQNKLYKQIKDNPKETIGAFLDNQEIENGFSGEYFYNQMVKATKEEIIQAFTKQEIEMKEDKEIIGYVVKEGLSYIGVRTILDNGVVPSNANLWTQTKSTQGWNIQENSPYAKEAKKLGILDSLFEPVYKKKEVVIAVRYDDGSFPVIISDKIYIEKEVKYFPEESIADIIDHYTKSKLKWYGYDIKVSKIDIGCHKGIHVEDIEKAYKIYKSLQ